MRPVTPDPASILQRQIGRPRTDSSRLVWLSSIAAAAALLAWLAARLLGEIALLPWWAFVMVLAGIVLADFVSGLVHWGADTWGRDDMPILGPRLLLPFRRHHVDPGDFLTRSFIDANGDVALLHLPILALAVAVPIDTPGHAALLSFAFGFCVVGTLTNQIHQWAHLPDPPRVVRWCQDRGLMLGRDAHARHHARPHDTAYCIATGWCNRPLEAIAFFRRLERVVTRLTRLDPREDDRRHAAVTPARPGATS
ncbi:MAG TPA: fatty acid desaturase CarF family protein [Vicinamibacterales bacterium]|nr:fatty acid desaturase CarF family protein [Vicinamibacterales bacterium]